MDNNSQHVVSVDSKYDVVFTRDVHRDNISLVPMIIFVVSLVIIVRDKGKELT